MFKKNIILLIISLLLANFAQAQYCSKLRRICRNNLNNDIFWNYNQTVPCGTFKEYRVYGRDKTSNPYTLLNTETNQNTINFSHLNANVPSNKNWDYFVETVFTCSGIDNLCYSDTQNVSEFYLPKSIIAYISVDILTNKPYIVWEQNKFPSFWYVDIFNDNAIKTGIIDTIFIDNITGLNPKSSSLKYVIAAVDSCTKRWDYLPADYHYTIYTTASIDTCQNKVSINWTKYIGWGNNIKYYYIYKNVNGLGYQLIDSVTDLTTTYIDKVNSNENIEYYISAVNSLNTKYNSNSNTVSIISGKRIANHNLKINYVTLNNNITLNINFNNQSDIDSIQILKSLDKVNYQLYKKFKITTSPIDELDLIEDGNRRVYYYLVSKNSCNEWTDTTNVSSNILLEQQDNITENKLWWNTYSTWNNGVEKYIIYRETRLNTQILNPFSQRYNGLDSFYKDITSDNTIDGTTLCYKVIGTENITGYTSQSNTVCIVGGMKVYFPDGIIARNQTNTFKPIGVYIDYKKSKMYIYNRWGKLVKEITDLNIGWDLTDGNDNFAETDTYVYDAQIIGLDGKQINKSGTITIIR
jgi:gliding motility-associated-like protein